MSECLICGRWQDSEPRCECYEEMLSLTAKLQAAEADARTWKVLFDNLQLVEEKLRAEVARLTEITKPTAANHWHDKYQESRTRIAELEAEGDRLGKKMKRLKDYSGHLSYCRIHFLRCRHEMTDKDFRCSCGFAALLGDDASA